MHHECRTVWLLVIVHRNVGEQLVCVEGIGSLRVRGHRPWSRRFPVVLPHSIWTATLHYGPDTGVGISALLVGGPARVVGSRWTVVCVVDVIIDHHFGCARD